MKDKVRELEDALRNLPEIKRLNELEVYIDKNPVIKEKINLLLTTQQQLVNCHKLRLVNAFKQYKEEYVKLKEELLLIPFVEEYLELLGFGSNIAKAISKIIESEIEEDIK